MKNREVESALRSAFSHITPGFSDQILTDCGEQKGKIGMRTQEKTTGGARAGRRMLAYIAAAAAVLMLLIGGGAGAKAYRDMRAVACTVSLDVNPSVEITVNRQERVLSVTPRNEEGRVIIGDMDFTKSTLEVTVNALLGSMLRNGYLNELSNSILISVQGEEADALRKKLAAEVNAYLENGAFLPSVVSFTDEGSGEDELARLASTYVISRGKAKMVQALTQQNPQYSAEALSALTVNELNLLLEKAEVMPDTSLSWNGEASTKAYIGEEEAERIALEHAGAAEGAAVFTEKTELDCTAGRMVYEVEFVFDGAEYEYDIDARTGEVVKDKKKAAKPDRQEADTAEPGIGAEAAKQIALDDAGVDPQKAVFTEVKTDKEDGQTVYEIEFIADGIAYEYEIASSSGSILKGGKEESSSSPAVDSLEQGAEEIGKDEAVSIALKHAGVDAQDAKQLKCRQEKEHGTMVYEVEFVYNGYEYEYDINSVTGKIIKSEKEKDD